MAFIKSQLRQVHLFYKEELGRVILVTGGIFLGAILVSFGVGCFAGDFAKNLILWFTQAIAQTGIIDEMGNLSVLPLFWHNLQAMALSTCYGFIPFISLPILSLLFNAALLGIAAAFYVQSGFSLALYLAGILPHGIFELPALVISLSCGILLCRKITDFVRHNTKNSVVPVLQNILRVFVCHMLPLLAAAALMEAYVTPLVMALFM